MAKPKWRTTRAWSSTSAWVQQQLVQNRRQQAAHLLPLPTRLLLALESQVSPVMMTNLAHRTTQHQTPNSNRQSRGLARHLLRLEHQGTSGIQQSHTGKRSQTPSLTLEQSV